MPSLPARPSLEHLKKQAKALLHAYQRRDAAVVERFRASRIQAAPDQAKLADAQHVIASEYGFQTWTTLKEHVESLERALDPRKAMIGAINADDVAKARRLFQRYPVLRENINDPGPDLPFGGRPFGHVAKAGSRAMVDCFLEFGADINARSDWAPGGWGVLDDADPEFAEFLISRGARLDAHSAAHLDKLDELRAFVTRDPDVVHARGGDGQTPLHFARSVAAADLLLAHGAHIDALDLDHEGTPAQWMIRDRTELARYLVARGARADMLLAVALGDIDRVREHLSRDSDAIRAAAVPEQFPMRGPHGGGHIYLWSLGRNKTALQIAKEFGHEDVWRLLWDQSPPDLRLTEACRVGDDTLVRSLVAGDPALVRDMPDDMRARLVIATQDDDLTAVRSMLAAGWPTDGKGQDQGTALHWAGFLGNAEIARELLKYGAAVDVREPTHHGTPADWTVYGSVHGWRCETGDFVGTLDAMVRAGAELPPASIEHASDAVRAYLQRAR
jgi:ankyrin repeat protein